MGVKGRSPYFEVDTMKPHLKRWSWLYGVCAFVVLWPLVLWRLQRIPPLDETTIRRAAEELDRQIEREYGPSIWKKYQAFDKKFEEEGTLTGNPRFERLNMNYLNTKSASSIMKTDINALKEQFGPRFEKWDRLVEEGPAYIPSTEILKMNLSNTPAPWMPDSGWMPNFLLLQVMAKARKAMALQSVAEADWDIALSRLESNARLSNPIQANYLIGNLIHIACRAVAYSSYKGLLWAAPPVEVQRKALQDLFNLQSNEPRLNTILLANDYSLTMEWLLDSNSKKDYWLIDRLDVVQSAIDKLGFYKHFKNSHLRAWAIRFSEKTQHNPDFTRGFEIFIYHNGLRWTTIPSCVRWLRETAEGEPVLFESSAYSEDLLKSGDPWTLAHFSADWRGDPNWADAIARGRVTVTHGRLLESAFAARLYRHDRGEWPNDVSELIPDYIPNLDSEEEQSNETGPYLPLQIAWLDIDEQTRQMLWQENLPMRSIRQLSIESRSDNRQTILTGYGRSQDWLNQPVIPIAVAQEFRAHPKLVADARVWMCTEPIAYSGATGIYPRELIDRLPWKPIDPDHARKITDRYDRMIAKDGPSMRNYDLSKIHSASDEEPLEYPEAIRFWAKLRAPEKALVIWSPGPDGVDDGGRIVYDPTNGTISGGDLVVFPEGY